MNLADDSAIAKLAIVWSFDVIHVSKRGSSVRKKDEVEAVDHSKC